MKTLVIQQPTYLPWVGLFDLIDQADLFVLLDTVAVNRQSWQTRNRVLSRNGDVTWMSIPTRTTLGQRLDTVRVGGDSRWRRKHVRTIQSLGPYTPSEVLGCYEIPVGRLVDFTYLTFRTICRCLMIETPVVWASSLELPDDLDRDQRVQAIFEATGAAEMLSTAGGKDYGVPTRWHQYEPTPYRQNSDSGEFVSHLSIVDCLSRHGSKETARIVRSGRMLSSPAA